MRTFSGVVAFLFTAGLALAQGAPKHVRGSNRSRNARKPLCRRWLAARPSANGSKSFINAMLFRRLSSAVAVIFISSVRPAEIFPCCISGAA